MHGENWAYLKEQGYGKAQELMRELDRLRMAWTAFRPAPPLKRGELALLGTMEHLRQTDKGPLTVGKLSRASKQSMPAISQKLNALEEGGYLRRVADKSDRRVVALELTEKGRQSTIRTLREFMGRMQYAMDQLGEEKSDTLLQLMAELSGALEDCRQTEENKKDERSGAVD